MEAQKIKSLKLCICSMGLVTSSKENKERNIQPHYNQCVYTMQKTLKLDKNATF